MLTIKSYLEAVQYKISDGSEYRWKCYGQDARIMDSDLSGDNENTASIVFDTKTHVVYQMEMWDGGANRQYRWINPEYMDAYIAECGVRSCSYTASYDDNNYLDIPEYQDILKKTTALANGEEYDTRVTISIDFDDDNLLILMKMAHEADLTFNKFVESVLREYIDNENVRKYV